MRSCTLIFVALATILLCTKYINAFEICAEENCFTSDEKLTKCEQESPLLCKQQGTTCCSVVKSKFRTHCRQHGGACMDECAPNLQRTVINCPNGQVCCVLV
ncbi:hypothetical protein EAG_16430 [Camponotus floridanus]|uniref:Uncharacterized protein n=1 Tax=Camponotus floridanus TaxID=104421 RepID=E2ASQ5_CAMFO|nr:uncharacterized protein LOC105255640 [Camponotus floridanus]EFN63537.1 hypothetical protein EAG_16430 [Camponotus floridanus]